MKTFLFTILFLAISSLAFGQVCNNNPSIQQGDIDPAPLYPGAQGVAKMTYFENLLDYSGWQTDPITITMCFLNIAPDNGASSVTGTASTWFNWLYDPTSNCMQGTQNQTIYGGTGGPIEVAFSIATPINCGPSNQMGFNANIQVAACMNQTNQQTDDTESVYTCYDPNGGTSSIEDQEQLSLDISLFPNPANKNITVTVNSELPSQRANLVITDMLGRTIKTIKNKVIDQGENNYKINIRGLANATYFLTIQSEDGTQGSIKFIKADN